MQLLIETRELSIMHGRDASPNGDGCVHLEEN